jgi:hypothetical protein
MKKLIISVLFGLFAFSAFAEKYLPTGECVGEFQIINVICDSYLEYEEKIEYFLENDETFQIVDRFEEERTIQIICKKCICFDEE